MGTQTSHEFAVEVGSLGDEALPLVMNANRVAAHNLPTTKH